MAYNMDNLLPKGLQNLMQWISHNNNVQSWRLSGENNLTLSIRFSAMPELATSTPRPEQPSIAVDQTIHSRAYRSKPPSAVNRDTRRQEAWLDSRQGDCIKENGIATQAMFTSGARGHGDLYSVWDSKNGYCNEANHTESGYVTIRSVSLPCNITSPSMAINDVHEHNVITVDNTSDLQYAPTHDRNVIQEDDAIHGYAYSNNMETQTLEFPLTVATQTEVFTVSQQCVTTQCPTTKKRCMQTDKTSTVVQHTQTDNILLVDKSSQHEYPKRQSCGIITDYPNGLDKAVATDPPIGRHVQTEVLLGIHKKVGRSIANASTQDSPTNQKLMSLHTSIVDQHEKLKAAMANDVAKLALDLKRRSLLPSTDIT